MIALLIVATLSVKQPSCPPPPPLPERIVAVIPKELELVNVKDERLLKKGENDSSYPLVRKMEKISRAKRQNINRRGVRNK